MAHCTIAVLQLKWSVGKPWNVQSAVDMAHQLNYKQDKKVSAPCFSPVMLFRKNGITLRPHFETPKSTVVAVILFACQVVAAIGLTEQRLATRLSGSNKEGKEADSEDAAGQLSSRCSPTARTA